MRCVSCVVAALALCGCGARTELDEPGPARSPGVCTWTVEGGPFPLTEAEETRGLGMSVAVTARGVLMAYATGGGGVVDGPVEYWSQLIGFDAAPGAERVPLVPGRYPGFGIWLAGAGGDRIGAIQIDEASSGCRFLPLDAAGELAGPIVATGPGPGCADLFVGGAGYTTLDISSESGATVIRLDGAGEVVARTPLRREPASTMAVGLTSSPVRAVDADGAHALVWQDDRGCIVHQRFGSDGGALSSALEMECRPGVYRVPSVVETDEGSIVVWREPPPDDSEYPGTIMIARVDASGRLAIPAHPFEEQRGLVAPVAHIAPGLAHGDVLVAWFERGPRPGGPLDLVLGVLAPSGVLRDPPRILLPTPLPSDSASPPVIVETPDGAVLIFGASSGDDVGDQIFGVGLVCL
jgi:hypothetical protein